MPTPELTKEQQTLIHKVYFKDKVYLGRDKLWSYIRQYYPQAKISRRQVMEWLKKQNLAQLYRPTRKTKDIAATVLSGPWQQLGIDLVDMQHFEWKKHKYMLTAVDLFSKMAWARPLVSKTTRAVAKAMESILDSCPPQAVKSIRSDNGSEFIGAAFKKMLSKRNITQVLSNPAAPQSNGQVERFNAVIKRMIKMHITQTDSNNWPKVLPQLIRNYNNVPSRVTKKNPVDVAYSKNPEMLQKVKVNIQKSIPKGVRKENTPLLNAGDKVRLKIVTPKNYKKDELWTRKIYTISKVFKPRKAHANPAYFVKDSSGSEFKFKLYENDLQLVHEVHNKVKQPEQFQISKIIKSRKTKGKARTEFLVKWLGHEVPTWEPESTLMKDVPKMLNDFKKKSS